MISKKAAAAAELAEQCRIVGLPMPTHYKGHEDGEALFHPTRKWRFDVAWINLKYAGATVIGPRLALEIDGGVFLKDGGGRHNRGAGYRNDTEKLNEAIILGWYVMRCLPEQIKSGVVITWIERFMLAHHVVLPKSHQPRRNYPNDATQKENRRTDTTERGNPIISTERGPDYLDGRGPCPTGHRGTRGTAGRR